MLAPSLGYLLEQESLNIKFTYGPITRNNCSISEYKRNDRAVFRILKMVKCVFYNTRRRTKTNSNYNQLKQITNSKVHLSDLSDLTINLKFGKLPK